ncbi:MAG: hypothetical protein IJA81_06490 [Akkermansia sp.]|nr:hypothetical protein [Akkermansia sp.]
MADKTVEEHNTFSRWDCVGATLMMGAFPVVVCILYEDKNIKGAIMWGGFAALAAGGVFLLSLILNERFLNRLVNWIGYAVVIYFGFWAWDVINADIEKMATDPALEEKKTQEKEPQQNAQL